MQTVAPQGVVTGEEAAQTEASSNPLSEKPMWVFVTGDSTADEMRKLEDVVFKNEKVGVGAKFFRCVKVSEVDASEDRILKAAGRGTPRMVFLRRDYTVHSVLDASKMSAGNLLKVMKALSTQTYENDFDTMLKEYAKLLNELDRLDSVRKNVEAAKERLVGKTDPAKVKKLDRDQKEYDDAMNAWTENEKKLLTFTNKGEKSPQA